MARETDAEIENGRVRNQNATEVEQAAEATAFKEREIGGIANG